MTSPSPPPAPALEILDLRHYPARHLRPLLEGEAAVWFERLRWDYAEATEVLLGYLDSRILPGFVATLRGRIVGFCFSVHEGNKAVLGDVYVDQAEPDRILILQTLTRHLLEVLEATPDVDRIEAQLLLNDIAELAPVFAAAGFVRYPRLFMETELHTTSPGQLPSAFEFARWTPGAYQSVADFIHTAYAGHIDAEINDQYRTLEGSLRFLHNIVRFPGCGTFDPAASLLVRERRSGTLAAVALCSRIAPGVAHLTQLCVAPRLRGQHLGRELLGHILATLPRHGFQALTLTVTEANESALHLYRTAGLTTRMHFDALVLDKRLRPERPFLYATGIRR